MRVCVMMCGRVAEPLADVMPSYLQSFKALLSPHLPEAVFVSSSTIDGEFPASVDDHDVYIFTGSPHGVYEDLPWIRAAEAFVRDAVNAGKVIVGGCFGHQLVAQALGGEVRKSERGWGMGVHSHALTAREPWMVGGPDALNVLVSHQDQVVRAPDGAVVLASSEFCPNAMLRIGDRVITMQGHPEMNVPTVNRLLDMRRDRVGEAVYADGKASLETPLDHNAMAQWLAGFIRSALNGEVAVSATVRVGAA
jgi:GMP synthase-like glutamine amidotransferase